VPPKFGVLAKKLLICCAMLKSPYIKISVFILSLFLILGIAFIKCDMFSLMGYSSAGSSLVNPTEELKPQSAGQKAVEEQESPDYFSIFKFINNLVPGKKEN
jgi:hypothetical protein